MDKFKMALDFLGWEEQDLNDVLIEFAENNMKAIFKKIKNNSVKTLPQKDLNSLCDEFMYALPDMLEQYKKDNGVK